MIEQDNNEPRIVLKEELEQNSFKLKEYDYNKLLEITNVDYNEPPSKPATLLQMANGGVDDNGVPYFAEYFTVGDISAVVGKSGNGKSNLISLLMSQMVCNSHKEMFQSELPDDGKIIIIDTEQSEYDVWRMTDKITKITEGECDNPMKRISVRRTEPLTPEFRMRFVLDLMEKEKPSLLVLDGVADVISSINDEAAAKEAVSKIRGIAQEHKVHVIGIIHSSDKNTGSSEAMGWIGTVWKHKAEGQMNVKFDRQRELFEVSFHKARHGYPKDWMFKFDGIKKIPYIPEDQATLKPDLDKIKENYTYKIHNEVSESYRFFTDVIDLFEEDHKGKALTMDVCKKLCQIVFAKRAGLDKKNKPGEKAMVDAIKRALHLNIIANQGSGNSYNLKLVPWSTVGEIHEMIDEERGDLNV